MQTFLPYSDFKMCAHCLDNLRLNKQILEAKTIHNIITGQAKSNAWVNHPIVKMWKGYPDALALYYNECLHEWKEVRNKNHKYIQIEINKKKIIEMPFWLGDLKIHSSHRANLLRKNFEFYSKYKWDENYMEYSIIPYFWITEE